MNKTVLYMSMSVDGFIAGPNVAPGKDSATKGGGCMSGFCRTPTRSTEQATASRA